MENNCNHYADITLALALKLGGTGGWKALQLPAQKREGEERVVCATVCGFIQWLETRRQKSRKIWFFLSRGAQHVTVFLIKEQSRMVGWPAVIQRSIVNNIVMERKDFNFWSFRETSKRKENERASEKKKEREEEKDIHVVARWLFLPSLQIWCIRRSFQSTNERKLLSRGLIMKITQRMAGITGIRSLFASIALSFQRSETSKPPFRDIAPENIRHTARILFRLIGVTCRANAWVGWLIDGNGDDENMRLEYLNIWGEWWSSEGSGDANFYTFGIFYLLSFFRYKVPLLWFKYFFFRRVSGDEIKIKIKSVIA